MEREEGELSEEEYEDVSDNSCISALPLILSGKSSPLSAEREPFRELSLTSVSDESVESDFIPRKHTPKYKLGPTPLKPLPRRNGYHKHNDYYKERMYTSRKRKKYSPNSFTRGHAVATTARKEYINVSSSSDSEMPDKKIWKQLRDAVRINSSSRAPNCSLRTRLKRMIEPDDQKSDDDDHELETLRDRALQSKQKTENQHPDPVHSPTNISDEDLIHLRLVALHSAVLKKHQNRRKQKEEQQQSKAPETSVHNNEETPNNGDGGKVSEAAGDDCAPSATGADTMECTQAGASESTVAECRKESASGDEDEDILRAMVLTSICKKMSDKKVILPKTAVKVAVQKAATPSECPPPPPVQSTNLQMNRFIISVNSDSESDEETQGEKQKAHGVIQNSDLFDKNLSLFLKEARAKSELHEDDIARHLPGPQQLEYGRLKHKLQQLSARSAAKMRRIAPVARPRPALANTDRQLSKVSRWQMKGKYEELGPLMTRVTAARRARDQAQAEVKRLINGLRDARTQLTLTHQTYTQLVQQLLRAKSNIDNRLSGPQMSSTDMCTSTPNKLAQTEITCELRCVDAAAPVQMEEDQQHQQPTEPLSLQYTSPLDHIQLQSTSNEEPTPDPLLVLCPYDLGGVCRDADCSYRHCDAPATH